MDTTTESPPETGSHPFLDVLAAKVDLRDYLKYVTDNRKNLERGSKYDHPFQKILSTIIYEWRASTSSEMLRSLALFLCYVIPILKEHELSLEDSATVIEINQLETDLQASSFRAQLLAQIEMQIDVFNVSKASATLLRPIHFENAFLLLLNSLKTALQQLPVTTPPVVMDTRAERGAAARRAVLSEAPVVAGIADVIGDILDDPESTFEVPEFPNFYDACFYSVRDAPPSLQVGGYGTEENLTAFRKASMVPSVRETFLSLYTQNMIVNLTVIRHGLLAACKMDFPPEGGRRRRALFMSAALVTPAQAHIVGLLGWAHLKNYGIEPWEPFTLLDVTHDFYAVDEFFFMDLRTMQQKLANANEQPFWAIAKRLLVQLLDQLQDGKCKKIVIDSAMQEACLQQIKNIFPYLSDMKARIQRQRLFLVLLQTISTLNGFDNLFFHLDQNLYWSSELEFEDSRKLQSWIKIPENTLLICRMVKLPSDVSLEPTTFSKWFIHRCETDPEFFLTLASQHSMLTSVDQERSFIPRLRVLYPNDKVV